jgi:DNA-binding CsgD family transcriptional regulator
VEPDGFLLSGERSVGQSPARVVTGDHTDPVTDVAALVGRESELQALLAALAPGSASRTVLRAEPGMGKTALLDAFLEATAALEVTVLHSRPTEVDQRLAFTGLADLLAGVEESAYDGLPDPQRRAIRAALLLEHSEADVDPRAVAAGVRTVWTALAERRPLVVVIDDTQWLDEATSTVLAHALRRVSELSLHVLAAGRPVAWPLEIEDATTLALPPLGPAALFHVVKEHLGLALDRSRLRAIETASGGNPLHSLELVRREVGDGSAGSLDELISQRVRELPSRTRDVLVAAALAASPTVQVLSAAATCTPEELIMALEPARASALVGVTDSVAFRHPLYARGVIDQAADLEVHDAHRRLAQAEPDPEVRARHLGAAASGPDADLADRLDEAATSARHRGGWESAVDLQRLAVELTPEQGVGDVRRARLAEWLAIAGRSVEAEAEFVGLRITASGPAYWRATIGLGRLWAIAGREPAALAMLDDVVGTDAPPVVQAEALLALGDTGDRRGDHVARAVALLEPLPRSATGDALLAAGLVMWSFLRAEKGEPFAELLARAVELQRESPPERVLESAEFVVAQQALFSERFEEARALLARLLGQCVATGEDFSLPFVLANIAHLEHRAGRWDAAEQALLEGRRLSEGQNQAFWQLIGAQLMLLTGLRGERERAMAETESLSSGALTTTDPVFNAIVNTCAGQVLLAHGDPHAAFEWLSRAIELAESVSWTDPGQMGGDSAYFDAAIGSGHLEEVEARLVLVEERSERLRRTAVLLACRRARLELAAVRGEIDDVVRRLPDLLAAYDAGPCQPLERAHAYVFAGKVYRRARQKRKAHDALTTALGVYEQIGCPPYAAQATAELARLGLRPGAPDRLTETERRVAALAAGGLRNKEIADQLFISAKTVEANLSRAYRKLGVRARTDLARALVD